MRKGLGRSQQIRGQKRRTKVLNRRKNRNPSDLKKFEGSYSAWLQEHWSKQSQAQGQTLEEVKQEIQQIKDSGEEAMSLPEMAEKLHEMKERENNA